MSDFDPYTKKIYEAWTAWRIDWNQESKDQIELIKTYHYKPKRKDDENEED